MVCSRLKIWSCGKITVRKLTARLDVYAVDLTVLFLTYPVWEKELEFVIGTIT